MLHCGELNGQFLWQSVQVPVTVLLLDVVPLEELLDVVPPEELFAEGALEELVEGVLEDDVDEDDLPRLPLLLDVLAELEELVLLKGFELLALLEPLVLLELLEGVGKSWAGMASVVADALPAVSPVDAATA